MKNKIICKLFGLSLIIFSLPLNGQEDGIEMPLYEWIDESELAITENGVYIDTNKGFSLVEVENYNEEKGQYLIDCSKAFK